MALSALGILVLGVLLAGPLHCRAFVTFSFWITWCSRTALHLLHSISISTKRSLALHSGLLPSSPAGPRERMAAALASRCQSWSSTCRGSGGRLCAGLSHVATKVDADILDLGARQSLFVWPQRGSFSSAALSSVSSPRACQRMRYGSGVAIAGAACFSAWPISPEAPATFGSPRRLSWLWHRLPPTQSIELSMLAHFTLNATHSCCSLIRRRSGICDFSGLVRSATSGPR